MNISFHDKFLLYLESTHTLNEEKRLELIAVAEERLPVLLQMNGINTVGDIYCSMGTTNWNDVSTDVLINTHATDEELRLQGLTMQALKYFKAFVTFNANADYKRLFEAKLRRERHRAAQQHTQQNIQDNSIPEKENEARKEGTVSQVCVTHYERNPEDRKKCLEKYGYVCQACGMNFEEVYGEIGHNFIEVHHLYPVCNMGENYEFDPLDEERGLVPLCSNCHSMIHRGGRTEERDGKKVMIPMTLQELKDALRKDENN